MKFTHRNEAFIELHREKKKHSCPEPSTSSPLFKETNTPLLGSFINPVRLSRAWGNLKDIKLRELAQTDV